MIERYKNDKKFRKRIGLITYGIFVIGVIIYSIVSNISSISNMYNYNLANINSNSSTEIADNKIVLPNEYKYKYVIKINDNIYNYSGVYKDNELTIIKEYNDIKTEYLYKNNNNYIKENDKYILTNINNVYDIVDYNYLNIDNINTYISKSTYDGNNYKIYVKDVLLDVDSNDYFYINYYNSSLIKVEIDYTNFVKQINDGIDKYIVLMEYEKV